MKNFRSLISLTLLLGISFTGLAQNWDNIIKATASDIGLGDLFGYSVSISGDYAIVGAPYENEDAAGTNYLGNAGSAYIFKNIAGSWTQVQKIVASDRGAEDWFGFSVSISGDYAIVGAPYEDEDAAGTNYLDRSGSAYIFKNISGTWAQVRKITAANRRESGRLGFSVSISDDYAFVATPYETLDITGGNSLWNAGAAYVYKNNADTWTQVQKIVPSDRNGYDQFGYSVSISGDFAIIGASYEDEDPSGLNFIDRAGSAYIFKNIAGNWRQVQKIVASNRGSYDQFGYSVSISGDYAIIGAINEDEDAAEGNTLPNPGSAYIFKNIAGTWAQAQKIVASNRGPYDLFGYSVSISGGYAIVGAIGEDQDVPGAITKYDAGSAYIFEENAGTWTQVQKIEAPDRGAGHKFGSSVSISRDYAIAGAPFEDANRAAANNSDNEGASYIFTNGGTVMAASACGSYTWAQNGVTYTSSGVYRDTIPNSITSDSVITLNLIVYDVNIGVIQRGYLLIADQEDASYQWIDCSNGYTPIVGAIYRAYTATSDGVYAVEVVLNNCTDTSKCINVPEVSHVNVNGNHQGVVIYPNPTRSLIIIETIGNVNSSELLKIYNMNGKLIYSTFLSTATQTIDLNSFENGIYFVEYNNQWEKVVLSK